MSEDPKQPVTAAERHKRAPPRGLSGQHVLAADRIMAEASYHGPLTGTDLEVVSFQAQGVRERGLIPMAPDMLVVGVGGELVPTDSGKGGKEWALLNTVDNPTYVTADASRARLDLAQDAGALDEALDAAETIQARDSLEKMLAHQLATAHVAGMSLAGQLQKQVEIAGNLVCAPEKQERAILNATRLAGAVARMQSTYQQGLLTLHRLRTGGKQTVVVQHTVVNEGGQAVVAGKMSAGKGRGSRRRKGGGE